MKLEFVNQKTKPMNSKNNRHQYRIMHTNSFSLMHPPGGLVAWPDGSTSKIGDRRWQKALLAESRPERKGFVAWPVNTGTALRA